MATKKTAIKPTKQQTADFKTLSAAELTKTIVALRLEIVELKRGTKIGDVQNVHAHGTKRKDLARALTALASASTVAEKEEK